MGMDASRRIGAIVEDIRGDGRISTIRHPHAPYGRSTDTKNSVWSYTAFSKVSSK